jgi:coenzyme F420 hydrogenase subunit beta
LADISFGDIHIKPYSDDTIGINSLIVRTSQMNELLQQAMRDGAIVMEELNEATLVASQKMARVKKTKYASLVYWCKRMRMAVPQYDVKPYSKIGFVKSLLYLMNLNLQYQVGHHRHLWFVIKYMLKKRKA